jgi:hypothetical protein
MLKTTRLLALFKHIFQDQSYGQSLQNYIVSKHPKTSADVELLERQWQYKQNHYTGGGQWL